VILRRRKRVSFEEGWCWGRPYSVAFSLNCSQLSIGVKACPGFGFGFGLGSYHQGLSLSLPTSTRIIALHFFFTYLIYFIGTYVTY